MLTTSTAPPRPAHSPPAPDERRRLRVVPAADPRDERRRRRARQVFVASGVLAAFGIFAVVVAHVLLMQGQFELQRLEQRSARAQAEYDRLRLQVSELESPTRIVATAQQKLGMVAPATITYLAPSPDASAQPSGAGAPAAVEAAAATDGSRPSAAVGAPPSWSSVKSTLAGE
ncbi:MAG TPA: cell division protein FtsL [Acidimicrobiales bacterium]|nr:cell division protein FtsL [Acidimicrobiales bacterium]